jgi:DNA-binding transcriptional regulator YbjK
MDNRRTGHKTFLSLKFRELSPTRAAIVKPGRLGPVARPRDQVRRRRELVAATSKLVARKGLASVRLRDIADAAGVTSGAVLYYYDGLDELFTAAYDRAVERFCRDREEAVAGLEDAAARLVTAIRLGIPGGPDDAEIRLLYELEAVAFRSPECAALMAAYVQRQVSMYASILDVGAAVGRLELSTGARSIARNIVALEDGQGIYVLLGRDAAADVEARIVDYVAAATGLTPDELRAAGGAATA